MEKNYFFCNTRLNNAMKKIIIIALICIGAISAALGVAGYALYQKPSVRFLLTISDVIPPAGCETKEITLAMKNGNTPMMVFTPANRVPGKYYFFLHGFSPEAYRHPTLKKMAIAIGRSTGRTVFVPFIPAITKKGWKLVEVADDAGAIYMELRRQYPGQYNAFGACVAGTGLLVAFNTIPLAYYPDKLFLYGPFFTGKLLVDYYNKAGVEIDYIVKMANALNSSDYNSGERELVARAITASKPGTTDREAMRVVLGDALFRRIDASTVDNKEFISINEGSIFTKGKKVPDTEFFIIHSTSDNIIPYSFGLSLHKFLVGYGAKSRFVGTRIFSHSEKMSIFKTYKEIGDLVEFLDDVFRDDDGN